MRFEGTSDYVVTDDLKVAVNAAVTLERPLLVKGEPGTGKTVLALEISRALGAPLIEWHVKSTTKALQGLYEYDAVSRLRDGQLGDARVHDIRNYIKRGKLWDAFVADERPVLLIDEIDKADIEFPNDLLQELDRMEFFVYETGETVRARRRPIVIITSNNEKELPDAFLRRCFFHYIRFPDPDTMRAIIEVHFPGIKQRLVAEALKLFYEIRDVPGMKKKPSTSELLDWLKLLMVEDIGPDTLRERDPKKLIPPCTARCSRTSRMCICSSVWPSWRDETAAEAAHNHSDGQAQFCLLIQPCSAAKARIRTADALPIRRASAAAPAVSFSGAPVLAVVVGAVAGAGVAPGLLSGSPTKASNSLRAPAACWVTCTSAVTLLRIGGSPESWRFMRSLSSTLRMRPLTTTIGSALLAVSPLPAVAGRPPSTNLATMASLTASLTAVANSTLS